MSAADWKSFALCKRLKRLLGDGVYERGGFVLRGGRIVECTNTSDDPENSYRMATADILKHANKAVALWHTHPGASSNLSPEDWKTFLQWGAGYGYAIVGTDGVRCYKVVGKGVVNDAIPAPRPRARRAAPQLTHA